MIPQLNRQNGIAFSQIKKKNIPDVQRPSKVSTNLQDIKETHSI